MIILVTVGTLLALAFGLPIAIDFRARKSLRRRARSPQAGQVEASKGDWLPITPEYFGHGATEYFPPPDDGRPPH